MSRGSAETPTDDVVDDLTAENDLYEDQIPLADWEELFGNGRHAAEA